ncbi:MAG TPA: ABC transporter substrate-binding protein [Chloroflexota bacterium]
MRSLLVAISLGLTVGVMGCATGPSPVGSQGPQGQSGAAQRTLVVAVRGEPPSVAAKPVASYSGLLNLPQALFNASLDFTDERQIGHPALAEALPELSTDSWKVFPDGRMETTYRLKSGLTWHDGAALVADDFVFSYQLYSNPDFGQSGGPPIAQIEGVSAPDSRTVVIRWKQLYGDAAVLSRSTSNEGLPALPRHILEEPLRNLDVPAFTALPFWSTEYVGLGPYRVVRWESGAYIEGQAFDGYVFGRPKIDRIRAAFIPDAQTALANVLAGEVQYVSDYVLSVPEGQVLEQHWAQDNGGTVLYTPATLRYTGIQLRPDYVEVPALLDVRVRQALASAIDAPTALEVLTASKGVLTNTITPPGIDNYSVVDAAIKKYSYDPRRTQTLMEEAGFTKGPDGYFASRDGRPLQFSVSSTEGIRNEQVAFTFADGLRRSGFDVSQAVVSLVALRLPETSAVVPGLQVRGGSNDYSNYTSVQIPRPENQWRGSNYGGWNSPDYDRAFGNWLTTLDPSERVKRIADMERVMTEQVPIIPHFFDVQVNPHPASLQGPVARYTPAGGGPFLYVSQWEWR